MSKRTVQEDLYGVEAQGGATEVQGIGVRRAQALELGRLTDAVLNVGKTLGEIEMHLRALAVSADRARDAVERKPAPAAKRTPKKASS